MVSAEDFKREEIDAFVFAVYDPNKEKMYFTGWLDRGKFDNVAEKEILKYKTQSGGELLKDSYLIYHAELDNLTDLLAYGFEPITKLLLSELTKKQKQLNIKEE